jgi:D-inositol-3-phosphate glycosyltransferase
MPQTVSAAACPTWAFRILSAMYAPIESFILNRTDAVLSARHVIEDYFQSSYPDLKDRFRPDIDPGSGVDLELFQPRDRKEVRKELGIPHDEKVVLFVGRLDPVKALDFQIDAFNSFASRVPNSRFLIVGEDWSEGYYQQYAQGYPQLHIQFLGEKRGLELAKMYNCADLLIIGSKHEGNSTVLREALCSGLGVVTTDVGDARELLTDPQMGEIVPFREPDVFAESMIRMFGRDSEDARKARLGIVSLLSDEAVFQPIFDLYRELLAARGIVPEEENPGTG